MHLSFLGGAGTVTGSRTLVEHGGGQLLVDCGLFQGFKHLRELNWGPFDMDVGRVDALLLTHAHLDHSGGIPRLVREGFRGDVYCTPATAELCAALWPDAAHLEEESAERANRKGFSKHRPALPLFTVRDAERALQHLKPVALHREQEVRGARFVFRHAGHILGASSVVVNVDAATVQFSGDVGRPDDPLHGPPEPPVEADLLVMESTYGDRHHPPEDVEQELAKVVVRTIARGGHVIVPAFAVGRTQRLLYHLERLQRAGAIPRVPVFLNSPLADRATEAFRRHPEALQLDEATCDAVCSLPIVVRSVEESIALNQRKEPCILIAGSGMATGGRVIHHLKAYAPHARNTVLFAGFQAGGTRGDRLMRGERTVRIFGEDVPVRCEVTSLDGLSAHADADELIAWVRSAPRLPGRVLLNHGEPSASDALRLRVRDELGVPVSVPRMGQTVEV